MGFENTDEAGEMYLGQSASMQPGDQNSIPLDPLGFITLPGNVTWYVVSGDEPVNPLLVMPGATDFAASPQAIAQSMIDVGVATAIAQAILGTGLPLVPNPVMLYDVTGGAGTAPCNIGFTIPNSALQKTCYDAGKAQAAADTAMINILGRPSGNTHPTFTKKFWSTVSDFTLPKNDMANYATFGTRVAVCFKPSFVTGRPANTNFRTDPGITAGQRAQANTDYAAIGTFFAALFALGFTVNTLYAVAWQEPEVASNSMTATDFQNVCFTYGAAINATGVPWILDIGSGAGVATAQSYCNAGLNGASAAGDTVFGLAQDLYAPAWPNVTPDAIGSIATAHGLPFGVFEFGCAPNNVGDAHCTNYLLGQHSSGGSYGILDYLANRIQNGLPLLDSEYYMGTCSATGAGDLTSPIGLDPTVAQPDFRINLYDEIYDTLTASQSSSFTIAANHTTTMPPLTPSPIGGLSPAGYLSYELALGLSAGAGSTNPFAQVTLEWYDFDQVPKDQTAIYEETWYVPMGTNGDPNGPLFISGVGRMHGNYCIVKINNQDSVACSVAYLQVAGVARPGQRSQWVWSTNANNSPAVPGFTLAAAANQSLQIGREEQQTVNAGTTKSWLNGLWGGQIFVRVLVSGAAAAGDVHFQLQPQPTGVFGTENILNESMGIAGGANDERTFTIAAPRCTLQAVFNNNDANNVICSYQLIAIETA